MLPREGPRWFTPKNALIAFLLLSQTALLGFLVWNEIDQERHPVPIFTLPPVTSPKTKS